MRYSIPLALASLGMLACAGARADFRANFSVVNGSRSHNLSRIELSGQHMRTDAGNSSMLFNVSNGRMLMLQHDRKQYMDMENVAKTANAAMARAKAALANLPPEQRAMIEKRLGNRMPGMMGGKVDVSVRPTGKREQVGKYACEIYSTTVNGRHIQDACLADAGSVGIPASDRATLHRAFEELKALMTRMSAGLVKSPLGGMPTGKFPVQITRFAANGRTSSTIRLLQVSKSAVPAGDFEVPAGYTERQMGGGYHH